jgi:hypothetical protein
MMILSTIAVTIFAFASVSAYGMTMEQVAANRK